MIPRIGSMRPTRNLRFRRIALVETGRTRQIIAEVVSHRSFDGRRLFYGSGDTGFQGTEWDLDERAEGKKKREEKGKETKGLCC